MGHGPPGGVLADGSVNLSARQCLSDDTVDVVAAAIARAEVPAEQRLPGVHRGLGDGRPAARRAHAARPKELGVLLAIDNFGTGQSSLRLLEQLPVDVVKIDRSFTAGMAQSRQEAAIVAAVIGLAHAFGLRDRRRGRRDARPGRPPAGARLRRRAGPLLRSRAGAGRADRARRRAGLSVGVVRSAQRTTNCARSMRLATTSPHGSRAATSRTRRAALAWS